MTTDVVVTPTTSRRLILLILLGSAVALALGVYGNVHDPSGRSLVTLFFTATINAEVWLGTTAVAGEHEFFCSIHPSMTGTISVTG